MTRETSKRNDCEKEVAFYLLLALFFGESFANGQGMQKRYALC